MVGGLWNASSPRLPRGGNGVVYVPDDDGDGQTVRSDGSGN
jgi:hypothetical protein